MKTNLFLFHVCFKDILSPPSTAQKANENTDCIRKIRTDIMREFYMKLDGRKVQSILKSWLLELGHIWFYLGREVDVSFVLTDVY